MKIRKIITYILGIISLIAFMLSTGVPEVSDWSTAVSPYFIVGYTTLILAVLIGNLNNLRKVIYPVFICMSAWAYKHQVCKTRFTQNTYRLYKHLGDSYENLFDYTQDLLNTYLIKVGA